MTDTTTPRPHRPWMLRLLIGVLLFGAGIGVYMARHHEIELYGGDAYQSETLIGCAEAEGVSCNIVNTSAWSEVLGVPTFAWAVPTYLLLVVLAFGALRGRHSFKPLIVAVGLATVGFSGWLYYVSVYELGYICLWCMRLYGINAAIVVLSAASGITRDDLPRTRDLAVAAAVFASLTVVTVGVQKAHRAHLLEGAPGIARIQEVSTQAAAPAGHDPEGDAPALSFAVTTEDGHPAQLVVQPTDAWKGNPEAKVAIVEFGDFECGYCKRASFELRRLYEAYKDDIVFVFKHFPLDPACNAGVNNKRHRDACHAAAASVCAQDQGRFWEMHDLLYKNNHQLGDESLLAYANSLELDIERFMQCMRDERGTERVKRSALDGKAVETHGTPRIWIGGNGTASLYRSGSSAEQMARAIESALGRTGAEATQNAARMREGGPRVAPVPADVPSMQHIRQGDLDFWIDTFEAGLSGNAATSGLHQVPATRMSWHAAQDACETAGKRLCTEQEWIAACQEAPPVDDNGDGAFADDLIEGNAYPYGDFHTPGMCWEDRRGEAKAADGTSEAWRPVYTGEMPGCVTASGVYDLTGNVEEWVGSTEADAVLLGGAFDTPDDKARCYRRNDTYGAGYASMRTGFRCCRTDE